MMFGLSTIRLVIYGVTAVAVIVGGFSIRQHYLNQGYRNAIESVAKRDGKAMSDVRDATSKVDDCRAAGSVWNTTSGLCE